MNDQLRQPDELPRLLIGLIDDQLDGADRLRLVELLRSDPAARTYYLRHMLTDAALRLEHTSTPLTFNGSEIRDQKSEIRNLGSPAPSPEPLIPPIIIDTSSLAPSPLYSTLFAPGGWPFSYGAATAITGVMLLVLWAWKMSHEPELAKSPPASKPPVVEREKPMESVGRITGMADCRWGDRETALLSRAASVPLGGKYALSSGLMEIAYDSGAKVILQGPCTYEVDSGRGGFLSLGKVTARVDKSEIRNPKSEAPNPQSPIPFPLFSVRTPTAVVTDLGTEFGVEVGENGVTKTRVFVGSVRLAAAASERGGGQGRVLHAGEVGRVDRSNPAIVVSDGDAGGATAETFVRVVPLPESVRRAEADAYAELVLSLRPAAYYRMERPKSEKDRHLILDSAPGGHHGELRLGDDSPQTPYVPGRFGDALRFRGPGVGDRVIVPDYPKATDDRLTVAAWVMAIGRPVGAMIASNWSIPDEGRSNTGQFHLGLFRDDGDIAARVTQRDGQMAEVREGGFWESLPLFLWQHVAMVADGTTLHLYRNGKEVASDPCAGVLPQPPVASLGVGCRTDAAGNDAHSGPPYAWYWQGRIDELAIFNQALSAQQIEQLYLGKPLPDHRAETAATGKGDDPMNGP